MSEFFDPAVQIPLTILVSLLGLFFWVRRARGALLLLALFVQLRYMTWRGAFTLDTVTYAGMAITFTLFLAEAYGLFQSIFFLCQTSSVQNRRPGKLSSHPQVDIVVTIVTEPLYILERTLVGCLAQDYPKDKFRVYVLDDGSRKEVKELAEELGCGYITRSERTHAKAGNLNNALGRTSGEFVVIFDVDHVPVRSFLRETLPYFEDPKMAFVQVPHYFFNPDIFQRNLRLERDIRNDQDLFFRVIQAGRDARNSSFFAGSSAVFRRKSLEEIGGFRTETITEDLHTSISIHERGWKSAYHDRPLAAGLSPESHGAYLIQRERWATGAIQILLMDNPLCKKGLSTAQKTDYFASIYYFFHGLPRIIYLAAPMSFLFFGVSAIKAASAEMAHYFFTYYFCSVLMMDVVGKGYRRVFWSDVYETSTCFSMTKAVLKGFLKKSKKVFVLTPKGETAIRGREGWRNARYHIALFIVLISALVYSIFRKGVNAEAFVISASWASFNLVLLATTIFSFLDKPQIRRHVRLKCKISCLISDPNSSAEGHTLDISEGGISLKLHSETYFTGPDVAVELISSYGERSKLTGKLLRQERDKDGKPALGILFNPLAGEERRSLIRQIFSPEERWSAPEDNARFIMDANIILKGLAGQFRKAKALHRLYPRLSKHLACRLVLQDEPLIIQARSINLSYSGLLIETKDKLPEFKKDAGEFLLEIEGLVLGVRIVRTKKSGAVSLLNLKVERVLQNEEAWRIISLPAAPAIPLPAERPEEIIIKEAE